MVCVRFFYLVVRRGERQGEEERLDKKETFGGATGGEAVLSGSYTSPRDGKERRLEDTTFVIKDLDTADSGTEGASAGCCALA